MTSASPQVDDLSDGESTSKRESVTRGFVTCGDAAKPSTTCGFASQPLATFHGVSQCDVHGMCTTARDPRLPMHFTCRQLTGEAVPRVLHRLRQRSRPGRPTAAKHAAEHLDVAGGRRRATDSPAAGPPNPRRPTPRRPGRRCSRSSSSARQRRPGRAARGRPPYSSPSATTRRHNRRPARSSPGGARFTSGSIQASKKACVPRGEIHGTAVLGDSPRSRGTRRPYPRAFAPCQRRLASATDRLIHG